jgi:cobalt-zinc-cadmium efflux system outer membrane protein
MRFIAWVPTTVLAFAMTVGIGHAEPITLEQAVARAARRPTVEMAGADVDAARASAAGARRPIYNPELGVAVGPRFAGGTTGVEADISIVQTIELGGKRRARQAGATARLVVAAAGLTVASRDAVLEARRAFQLALVARARVDSAKEAEQLATQIATATRDRKELGSGTLLETNLANAEVGRARHDRIDAVNDYETALVELAAAVGTEAGERLEPEGVLADFAEVRWTEDQVVERALARRPELTQARGERGVAAADVKLADALGRPDLTVGLSYGFEQDLEVDVHTALLSASISLPVRNRNQGERAAARARQRRADLDHRRQELQITREARLALTNYLRARDAVLGFDAQVTERLDENLVLARDSFESGKIDYFEFNVVRRELIASRAAYLDAVAEAVEAWHALMRAAGEEKTP